MMNKDFFQEVMIEEFRKRLPDDVRIAVKEYVKNNDEKRIGISFHSSDNNISPVLYTDSMYNEYLSGLSVETIADRTIDIYNNSIGKFDTSIINKDSILENSFYRMMNAEMNSELLSNVPVKRIDGIDDIVLVPYMTVELAWINDKGCVRINNDMLNSYGISSGELEKAARNNTCQKEFMIKNIGEVISDMSGVDLGQPDDMPNNYVVADPDMSEAASIFANPDFVNIVSSKTGLKDFYIIPSSIYELIIFEPIPDMDNEYVHGIIKDVNSTMSKKDILSYNFYKCKDGVVSTISADMVLEDDLEL